MAQSLNWLLLQYAYLQLLDLLTTVVFLLNGVQEGNPLVRLAIHVAPSPLHGLVLIKILALALGIFCWRVGKERLLGRINLLFAAVVAWNLSAAIVASLNA